MQVIHKWLLDGLKLNSLRKKLIFTAVMCLVLPTVITVSLSSYLSKDVMKEQNITNAKQNLNVANQYVSVHIQNMINATNIIQFDTELNSILLEQWRNEYAAENLTKKKQFMTTKRVTEKLENLVLLGNASYITILFANGSGFSNYSSYEYDLSNLLSEPWIQQLKNMTNRKSYWLGVTQAYIRSEKSHHPYFITVVRYLNNYSNTPYAYLVTSINENKISDLFAKGEAGQEIFLIDEEGRIVSHQNKAKIGEYVPYAHKLPDHDDSTVVTLDNEEFLMVKQDLSYGDWTLVSLTPQDRSTGQIDTIHTTNLFLQVTFFSLFLIIMIYLVRQLTKPVTYLGSVASQVDAGNLQVRSNIRGSDEIGKLGTSFDQMLDRIKNMIHQIELEQTLKRKAELDMLQAQINPHFLFNILNSIRLKISLKGDKESAELIRSLSSLLRMTINRNNEFITLYEEVETIRHYVRLLNVRHKDKIHLEVDIDKKSSLIGVPRFFLQPIIENAYIHGFNQKEGRLFIKARLENDYLTVKVEDNGKGMDGEQLQNIHALFNSAADHSAQQKHALSGIGLRNVYERLQIIYNRQFHMEIQSEPLQGTSVTFYIPTSEEDVNNV